MCIAINGSEDKIRSGLGSELTSSDCAPQPSAFEPAMSSYAKREYKRKIKKRSGSQDMRRQTGVIVVSMTIQDLWT